MPTVFYTTWLSCDGVSFGPGRILLLLTACFITFYVHRDCHKNKNINVLFTVCIAGNSENSGQISVRDSNTECMQIEFEFEFFLNQSSKIRTLLNISMCNLLVELIIVFS